MPPTGQECTTKTEKWMYAVVKVDHLLSLQDKIFTDCEGEYIVIFANFQMYKDICPL